VSELDPSAQVEDLLAQVDALTAERDRLRTELADAEEVGALSEAGRMDARAERDTLAAFAEHLGGLIDASVAREHALAARLAQAERVVEAVRLVLDAATAAMGAVPMDQQSPTSLAVLRQIIEPIIAVLSPALAAVDALDGTAGPGEEGSGG